MGRKEVSNFDEGERYANVSRDLRRVSRRPVVPSYLGEVRCLPGFILGDLMHRVLGALFCLAVGSSLLGDVHHLPAFAPYRSHPTKATNTGRQGKAGEATQRYCQRMNRKVRFAKAKSSREVVLAAVTPLSSRISHTLSKKHRRPQLQART